MVLNLDKAKTLLVVKGQLLNRWTHSLCLSKHCSDLIRQHQEIKLQFLLLPPCFQNESDTKKVV